MGIANKYNKNHKFTWSIKEGTPYKNLKELVHENGMNYTYLITCVFMSTKSKYGVNPIVCTPSECVNLPKHLTDTVNNMLNDDEVINAINSHKLGFTIYDYVINGNTYYSVSWVDID